MDYLTCYRSLYYKYRCISFGSIVMFFDSNCKCKILSVEGVYAFHTADCNIDYGLSLINCELFSNFLGCC